MSNINYDKPTGDALFSQLLEHVNRETEIGKKYASALTLDDLTYMAAAQICIAAASIMFSFRYPKRGSLVLYIMKKVAPSAYTAYRDRDVKLFSQCVLFVVNRMKEHMEKFHSEIFLPQS